MEKTLIILSDNNKGKFISKGFSDAFKELSYFVYEKKVYDINIEEINKIAPEIIFIFWTDMTQKEIIIDFLKNYQNKNTVIINCAELKNEIPASVLKKKNSHLFTTDAKKKQSKYIQCINPRAYKTKFQNYKYTITFSGNPSYPNREKILSDLIKTYGIINIFSRSYDFYKSVDEIYKNKLLDDNYMELYRKSYKGYVENPKELSQIYSSSKINIDMENENTKEINYRCLEIMASGGFLIAPYNDKIIKYFENGIEFETYNSTVDLIDKIDFYLKNLNIAQLIQEKGRKNIVNNFSFYDRLKVMLKVVYGKDISNR